jgi:hypothetical protein
LAPGDRFLIRFAGPDAYHVVLPGSGFAVVFEDDGETGYLYATDETANEIFDALQLYVRGRAGEVAAGDELVVVWNSELQKVGVHYCCRAGWLMGSPSA